MKKPIPSIIEKYLTYCKIQKRLDEKTLKSYCTDLRQFSDFCGDKSLCMVSISDIEDFIGCLNQKYKPKTSKRKLASLKAFFHYLQYKNIIDINPFSKMRLTFREPLLLPRTIPLYIVESFLSTIYNENSLATTAYRKKRTLLDIAIIETLFSTGIRISELCNLKLSNIDLHDAQIHIYGKGAKERIIQIGNEDVIQLLKRYRNEFFAYSAPTGN